MDANALKLLLEVAQKHAPRFHVPPGNVEDNNVYYVSQADGTLEKTVGMRATNHVAHDIASVVQFAHQWQDCDIFYSRDKVVAIHIQAGDRITKELDCSRPFKQLIDWDGQTIRVDQIGLFRLLRTTFRDCLGQNYDSTLAIIKNVDIKKKQDASTSVSRAGVSVSKSIMADVSGIDKIPEHFTFTVPIFDDTDLHAYQHVRVSVDVDPQTESFLLTVLPGEIEKAWRYGELYLSREIDKEITQQFQDKNGDENGENGETAKKPAIYYGEVRFGDKS